MNRELSQRPIVIGGGGHTRSLIAMAPAEQRPEAYIDLTDTLPMRRLGNDDEFLADERYADEPVIVGFVAPESCNMMPRRRLIEKYADRRFVTVIADDATVEPDTVIGAGTMIFHRAVVNTGVFLGDHVVVNTGAIVEHDTTVGENTFIGPGAILLGGVTVGRDVYIGAGSCVRNGATICDGVTLAMCSVVAKDIETPGFYAGNPARRIKG